MPLRDRPKIVPKAVRAAILAGHAAGWTLATIVKRVGVEAAYARALIERERFKHHHHRADRETRLEMAQAYGAGKTGGMVARKYGVSDSYVRHTANRLGMGRRKKSAAHGA